jgi:hypothetical protein
VKRTSFFTLSGAERVEKREMSSAEAIVAMFDRLTPSQQQQVLEFVEGLFRGAEEDAVSCWGWLREVVGGWWWWWWLRSG